MSKTWKCAKHPWTNPAWWRKLGNRQYRTRCRQQMREKKYDRFWHPKRDRRGYYW